jgi:TonB family protein
MQVGLLVALSLTFSVAVAHSQQSVESAPIEPVAAKVGVPAHFPIPILTPLADYPIGARNKNLTGLCVISIVVDIKGKPQNLQMVRCTDDVFAESAIRAVADYRFKPATASDGSPMMAKMTIEVKYSRTGGHGSIERVTYSLHTPPGAGPAEPDANGVYPLVGGVEPPKMISFNYKGFGMLAFAHFGKGVCDIVLTINSNGKPSAPSILQCDNPALEKPAISSLLESRYKPGQMNEKTVAVRVLVHLAFEGFVH